MFRFIISVLISLPGGDESYRVYSPDQYSQALCGKKAEELAERIDAAVHANARYAIVRTSSVCFKVDTVPI